MYDHDIEKNILSAIASESILNVSAAKLLVEKLGLRNGSFHSVNNAILFSVFKRLLESGKPIDPFAVKTELKTAEGLEAAGGWEYVSSVTMEPSIMDNSSLLAHAETLNSLCARRMAAEQLKASYDKIRNLSYPPEIVISDAIGNLATLNPSSGKLFTLRDSMDRVAADLDDVQSGTSVPVVKTGIKSLDAVIGGIQPTLTAVGGLPGVGKSALCATVTRNLAIRGDKVGVVNLEDEASWLAWRILSFESGVNQFKLRYRRLNEYDLDRTGEAFSKLHGYANNVIVRDGSDDGMTWDQVVSTVQDMVVNHGIRLAMVDHIGEIKTKSNSPAEKADEISYGLSRLRAIANKHKTVGIWALLHLRRRDGLGPGDEPTLTDFAASAGVERKARVAIGLTRAPGSDNLGMCVLKQTMGKAGVRVNVEFEGAAAMIRSIEGPQDGEAEQQGA